MKENIIKGITENWELLFIEEKASGCFFFLSLNFKRSSACFIGSGPAYFPNGIMTRYILRSGLGWRRTMQTNLQVLWGVFSDNRWSLWTEILVKLTKQLWKVNYFLLQSIFIWEDFVKERWQRKKLIGCWKRHSPNN